MSCEWDYAGLKKILEAVDEMIEKLKALLEMYENKMKRELESTERETISNRLSFLFEQKDVYDDPDIEEIKQPMQRDEFLAKARRIITTIKENPL